MALNNVPDRKKSLENAYSIVIIQDPTILLSFQSTLHTLTLYYPYTY